MDNEVRYAELLEAEIRLKIIKEYLENVEYVNDDYIRLLCGAKKVEEKK